jgi:hypothetical protein
MTPDDLDLRLRRAFDEVSSAWQPKEGSATELVSAVSRRRARQHRSVMAIGCAVVATLALVVGVGVYSTTSKPGNREASIGLHGPTAPTGSGSPASSGLSPRVVPPQPQANRTLECALVTVESGVSRCGGVYVSTPPASSGFSAQNSTADTASATSTPASVTVEVGQHVTVRLPAASSGAWRGPGVVATSRLSATLRQELPSSQSPAHPGVVRVGRVRGGAKGAVTAVFEAAQPGDVVLTATLARACAQAKAAPPSCAGAWSRWVILLVVVPD